MERSDRRRAIRRLNSPLVDYGLACLVEDTHRIVDDCRLLIDVRPTRDRQSLIISHQRFVL